MSHSGQVSSRIGQARVRTPLHRHPEALLIVSLRGAATVGTPEHDWELPPRSLLWLPGDTLHRVRTAADHVSLVLSFPPALVARSAGWIDASGFVHDLIERMDRAPDPARRDRLTAVLVDELAEPSAPSTRLRLVTEHVARHPATPVVALAREVGMSERSFRRWFRTEVGTSFTQWHQQRLVDRAIEQLRRGESVKGVAADLGYASPSAFIAMFKRVTGVSPQRYLRSSRPQLR